MVVETGAMINAETATCHRNGRLTLLATGHAAEVVPSCQSSLGIVLAAENYLTKGGIPHPVTISMGALGLPVNLGGD